MSLSVEQVRWAAHLSRLELDPADLEKMAPAIHDRIMDVERDQRETLKQDPQ